MKESTIEAALRRAVVHHGGLALKFVSPGMAGVPDRLLLFPGGRMAFVEVKAPGRKPRPLQKYRFEQLKSLGFPVYVIDGKEQIESVISQIYESTFKGDPRRGQGGDRKAPLERSSDEVQPT